MKADFGEDRAWKACPAGTLGGYARVSSRRRRIRIAAASAGILFLPLFVFGWSGWWSPQPIDPARDPHAGITCSQVQSQLKAYAAGDVPAAVGQQIRRHLDHCPGCRQAWRQLVEPSASQTVPNRTARISAQPPDGYLAARF